VRSDNDRNMIVSNPSGSTYAFSLRDEQIYERRQSLDLMGCSLGHLRRRGPVRSLAGFPQSADGSASPWVANRSQVPDACLIPVDNLMRKESVE
jgi:hypothetical protein